LTLLVFAAAVATARRIDLGRRAGRDDRRGRPALGASNGNATRARDDRRRFLVGAARNLWPAVRNAYVFSRGAQAPSGARLWSFISVLADELLPGRVVGRRVVAEAERAMLAADLHALVLPDLRRAAATAEAAGLPAEVQVDLRRALEDVEH
jgi:hypothetical protein